MMVLVCTNLTGCKLQANIDNILSGIDIKNFKDTVAEDNLFAMSSKTKESQQNALDAMDKADYYANKAADAGFFTRWWYEGKYDKWSNKSIKLQNEYTSNKATDSVWLKDREDAGKTGANVSSSFKRFGWLIFVAIIIGLIVLFKMLKMRKKEGKARAKTEKIAAKKGNLTVVEAQPKAIDTSASQAVLVDRNLEKSIESCKKYCNKYRIDYDTYLAQHNGDPKALLDFLIASSADDFK